MTESVNGGEINIIGWLFKEISEIVLQEYKRQQREEILEELLKDLKRQSDIKINEGFTN